MDVIKKFVSQSLMYSSMPCNSGHRLKTLPNNFYLIMAFSAFRKSRMASMALTVINDRDFGTFKCGLQRQINSAHFIHFQ